MDFSNKVFLITGASGDIGKCLCLILEKYNATVIKIYNKHKINDTNAYKCDISSEKSVKKLLKKITKVYGHIDYLINAFALSIDNVYKDKSASEFKNVLNTNVIGVFLMTKYFSTIMDKGVIINMSSLDASKSYNEYSIDYAASKAAIENMTKNFANILKNVKVCALAPAWVDTSSTLEIEPHFLKSNMQKNGQKNLIKKSSVALKIIEIIINDTDYVSGDIIVMEDEDGNFN